MKKIIAVISALAVIGCVAVLFYGCGADDNMDNTTTTIISTTEMPMNDGIVTDQSKENDNGAIGDAITKTSEMISDAITKTSEEIKRNFD